MPRSLLCVCVCVLKECGACACHVCLCGLNKKRNPSLNVVTFYTILHKTKRPERERDGV